MVDGRMDLLPRRPQCQVIAFPPARRVDRVRRVAENLLRKRGRAADVYWKQTVTRTRNELNSIGAPASAVEFELRAFFDAIQAEMIRQTCDERRPGGDAA